MDWWYCEDIDNNMDCNYDSGCNVIKNTSQIANALILMEVGMEQQALNNNNIWCNKSIIAGSMQPIID